MMAVAVPISILVSVPVSVPGVTVRTISVCVMPIAVTIAVPILFLRSQSGNIISHHDHRAHHARQNLRLTNH